MTLQSDPERSGITAPSTSEQLPALAGAGPFPTDRAGRKRPLRQNPKTEALAYRIWGYATPRAWNVTSAEIADALGAELGAVRRVIGLKQWTHRIRRTKKSAPIKPGDVFADHSAGLRF